MEKINNETLSPSERNIFEEFYDLIEKHRISSSDFMLGDFYDYLSEFDLTYQHFTNQNKDITNKIVDKYLEHCLYIFLVLFKFRGFSDRSLFYAFKRFINWFTIVLKKNDNIKSEFFFAKNIEVNFPSLWDSKFLIFLQKNPVNFNLFQPNQFDQYLSLIDEAEENISIEFGFAEYRQLPTKTFFIYGKDFSVLNIEFQKDNYKVVDTSYEMTLDFYISLKDNDGSKLISIFNLLLTSLSHTENVKVFIDKIEVGSLISRIRIYMKDLLAKEETKAIIEATKEGVGKALTGGLVSYSEIKKVDADIGKIKVEKEILEKELLSKPTVFEAKMENALELEKKALVNEQLKVDITKQKLEIIEKLSDLAIKGILEADEIKIDINEILYLFKDSQNKVTLGHNEIDEIT